MKNKLILILTFSIVIICLGFTIYLMNRKINASDKKIQDLEKTLFSSNKDYLQLLNSRDSLFEVNTFLSKYKALTVAMSYRDNVRLPLKYNVGNEVFLKRDSSKVLVTDIIVGGGKYEYYIKYKVMLRNGQEEDVIPELLY